MVRKKQKVLKVLFGRKLQKKKYPKAVFWRKKVKKTLSRWVEAGAFCFATHGLLLNSFLNMHCLYNIIAGFLKPFLPEGALDFALFLNSYKMDWHKI